MCAANQTWVDPHTQSLHYSWPGDQYSSNYSPAACSPLNYTHHYPAHFSPAAAAAIPAGKTYDYEGSYGANFFTSANYFPQTVPRDQNFYPHERPGSYSSVQEPSSPIIERAAASAGKLDFCRKLHLEYAQAV